ncbi:GGDEF domain-containing protein [Proteinivorax tanatarense]|uniref:GGDEF domain-containing protein n=1 Tax=Proteinivorax tanatarense TaxID=1260629 RepID=A0AAU7VMD7_9FIRM
MSIPKQDIKDIVEKITAFDKMYQIMRIVDPIRKKVLLDQGDNNFIEKEEVCHGFWEKNTICENCISTRAYNEDDTFIKLEYKDNRVFMITAVPIKAGETKVVVELLKDVTKSMILEEEGLRGNIELKYLLDQANLAAVTDELTKIYNKRYIIERLPVDLLTNHLNNEPLSIIMGDLDHFKNVNDTYGHNAGDYVLREFALLLKNNIREDSGWVARFGGEEFLVCLPTTDLEEALKIAERIRTAVKENNFVYKEHTIKLTSSFGVYTVEGGNIKVYEDVIEVADKNLYKAKQSGRDRVIG